MALSKPRFSQALEEKRKQQQLLQEEIMRINAQTVKAKEKKLEEEKLADLRDAEYQQKILVRLKAITLQKRFATQSFKLFCFFTTGTTSGVRGRAGARQKGEGAGDRSAEGSAGKSKGPPSGAGQELKRF